MAEHEKVYGVCENKCFVEIPTCIYNKTTDVVIGKWVDGKDLKQRIINDVVFSGSQSNPYWTVSYSSLIDDNINVKSITFYYEYNLTKETSKTLIGKLDCCKYTSTGHGASVSRIQFVSDNLISYDSSVTLRGTLIIEYTDAD